MNIKKIRIRSKKKIIFLLSLFYLIYFLEALTIENFSVICNFTYKGVSFIGENIFKKDSCKYDDLKKIMKIIHGEIKI